MTSTKGEEEEQKGTAQLADHGYEVVTDFVRKPFEARYPVLVSASIFVLHKGHVNAMMVVMSLIALLLLVLVFLAHVDVLLWEV